MDLGQEHPKSCSRLCSSESQDCRSPSPSLSHRLVGQPYGCCSFASCRLASHSSCHSRSRSSRSFKVILGVRILCQRAAPRRLTWIYEAGRRVEKGNGARRARTVGLLNAIQALSQLSYSPIQSTVPELVLQRNPSVANRFSVSQPRRR